MLVDEWIRANKLAAILILVVFVSFFAYLDNRMPASSLAAVVAFAVIIILATQIKETVGGGRRELTIEEMFPIVSKRLLFEPREAPEGILVKRFGAHSRRVLFGRPMQLVTADTENSPKPMLLLLDAYSGKVVYRVPDVESYLINDIFLNEMFNLQQQREYQTTSSAELDFFRKQIADLQRQIGRGEPDKDKGEPPQGMQQ